MCGRFTLRTPVKELAETFDVPEPPALQPRFNIAPTQPVATVMVVTGGRELRMMRWGLIPAWAKDASIGSRMINARAETVAEKPAFRSALRHRRCLILADGFYEWARTGATKQPYHFVRKDRAPFAFAGLWDTWKPPDDEPVESCTIITTTANELLAEFHDRMPAILGPADYDLWLNPAVEDAGTLVPLLKPYPADAMEAYPVSGLVNSPTHEDPKCLERAR